MRNVKKLVQLLVVAALLALPVAAVSAQSGTASNGYGWDGASDWPGVTSIAVPEALPETGIARFDSYTEDDRALLAIERWGDDSPEVLPPMGSALPNSAALNGFVWDGTSFLPDIAGPAAPEALPATGEASSKPPFYAALPPFLSAQAPDTLPETGFDQAGALREAYAQLRHDGSVAPSSLPETGSVQEAEARFSTFVWDGMTYVPDSADFSAPEALPETGASLGLNGRDRQVILDQMAARGASAWSAPASAQRTVNLDGVTGRDRQTIIDQLAASGVTVTTAQPATLPETGASGASIGSPSDPPLIGAGARAAEFVVQQDASLSDPPLLDTSSR